MAERDERARGQEPVTDGDALAEPRRTSVIPRDEAERRLGASTRPGVRGRATVTANLPERPEITLLAQNCHAFVLVSDTETCLGKPWPERP